MKIDNELSFADLMAMKEFLEKERKEKKEWKDSGLAYGFDEWERRANILASSDIDDKLKLVDNRIKEIIRVSFF